MQVIDSHRLEHRTTSKSRVTNNSWLTYEQTTVRSDKIADLSCLRSQIPTTLLGTNPENITVWPDLIATEAWISPNKHRVVVIAGQAWITHDVRSLRGHTKVRIVAGLDCLRLWSKLWRILWSHTRAEQIGIPRIQSIILRWCSV